MKRVFGVLAILLVAANVEAAGPLKFPRPVYWVANFNTPSYHMDGTWDLISWDGALLVDAKLRGLQVIFIEKGEKHFFQSMGLTHDPRLSELWWSTICDPAPNLWWAIEHAALSEKHPWVTQIILEHIRKSGMLRGVKLRRMSSKQICEVLKAYTTAASSVQEQPAVKNPHIGISGGLFVEVPKGEWDVLLEQAVIFVKLNNGDIWLFNFGKRGRMEGKFQSLRVDPVCGAQLGEFVSLDYKCVQQQNYWSWMQITKFLRRKISEQKREEIISAFGSYLGKEKLIP